MRSHLMRMLKDERGQILPWMVFLSVLVIGAGGLTVDLGHAYICYRELQASTDAAALAGAYAMTASDATQASVTAKINAFASVANGANANSNLPSPKVTTTFKCITGNAIVAAPCTSNPTDIHRTNVFHSGAGSHGHQICTVHHADRNVDRNPDERQEYPGQRGDGNRHDGFDGQR